MIRFRNLHGGRCDICSRTRNKGDHSACARARKARGDIKENQRPRREKMQTRHIEFLTKRLCELDNNHHGRREDAE